MQIRDLIPWGRREGALAREGEDSPVLALQRDLNRVFDNYWKRFDQAVAGFSGAVSPRVDVCETDAAVEVTAELPGMDEKEIDLSVTEDALVIKGEKKSEREESRKGFYLSERTYGSFFRSIPLPPGVEPDKADAQFKRGVLTITIPKSAEAKAKAKKIEVKPA